MNYIAKNTKIKYWRIRLIPINDKGYGSAYEPVFKGKTLEGALKAATKHCQEFKMNEHGEWFQVYGIDKVLYECDYWGREV